MLMGMDVPEAHCPLDRRAGGRRDPFAVRTAVGWILLGPIGSSSDTQPRVNHLRAESLECIMLNEFSDLPSIEEVPSIQLETIEPEEVICQAECHRVSLTVEGEVRVIIEKGALKMGQRSR